MRVRDGTCKKKSRNKIAAARQSKKRIEFWIGINCIHCNTEYL